MLTCPNCGAQAKPGSKFCQSCGAAITQAPVVEEQPVVVPTQEPIAPQEEQFFDPAAPAAPVKAKKKLPLLPIILGAVGVVVVAAIVILLLTGTISFGKKKGPSYALYVKDGEMFYNSLKKNSKSWQVTDKLFDSDEFENEDIANYGGRLAYSSYLSDNGKYIFYIDKLDENGATLYYREVGNDKAEPVKIDSDIEAGFYINEAANLVTYMKDSDDSNTLYQYNVKKDSKEKIASDVYDCRVSEDGKTILFENDEGNIYLKVAGKDKEKLASEIDSMEYVSKDMKTFYYTKEDSLYKQVIGKDKEKIASDINEVLKIYESGEIYYTAGESKEVPLMDYVTDDLKNSDAAMVEPVSPSYPNYPSRPSSPYWWQYDTDEEYNAAYAQYETDLAAYNAECDRLDKEYQQAQEAYYAAQDAYYAKLSRDNMRESLNEMKVTESNYSLYYFDGKKETLVSDAIYYYASEYSSPYATYNTAKDAAVIWFESVEEGEKKTIKMSEITDTYYVQSMVREAMNGSVGYQVAVKATASVLEEEENISNIRISPDGSAIFYIDNVEEEKDYGVLYRVAINKDKLGKAEVYDDDVYNGSISIMKDGKIVYFKEVTYVEGEGDYYGFSKGEMYIDKAKVDSDVKLGSYTYDEDAGLVYYTDYDNEKDSGTLKIYKNGKNAKATKIADDVYYDYGSGFTILPDGRILYLTEYSLKNYKGELNEWNNGKTRKIDDDVVTLIPIFSISDLYEMYY